MACRYKLIMVGLVLLLFLQKGRAQFHPVEFPKKALLALQSSKPDTSRIRLLLTLASYYLDQEHYVKKDLDSGYILIKQANQLCVKLNDVNLQYEVFAKTGQYFVKSGYLERGVQYAKRVINYHHKTRNLNKEADSWQDLGQLYNNNGHLGHEADQIAAYQHARSIYMQNHEPVKAATALIEIAYVHTDLGLLDLAGKELNQVLEEYKASGYKKLQDVYRHISSNALAKGNYYRALSFASEGVKSMRASGDTLWASQLYHHMAMINFAVKNYSDALEWIRKAVIAEKGEFSFAYKCVLVQTLLELNKTKEAYLALKGLLKQESRLNLYESLNLYRVTALYYNKVNNSDRAVHYNLRILNHPKLKDVSDDYFNKWSVICDNEIAGIFIKSNEPAKAGKYLIHAALIFKNAQSPLEPRHLATFYGHSYKYNLAMGQYRAAVVDLENRDRIQDSLFTADKDKQVAELNIQYQSAQREQSIRNLRSQRDVQQARLETANLQRNITIAGILLMIGVSAFIYRTYQHKQQANKIITEKNQLLQHLVTEKEWLLKEVHHRVKNNLHTVISLLESQARYLENDALKAIETSQNRIFAMSLIHQQLYQSEDIKTIEMASYIAELVSSLRDSFDTSRIEFTQRIDPINLTISYAIPLGLIINEAVTNSIKYAFPDNRKGEIRISMIGNTDLISLELADNGIGMPEIKNDSEHDSMGLRLMRGLSEDIDAEIHFESANGTKITIVFKPDAFNDVDSFVKPAEHEWT